MWERRGTYRVLVEKPEVKQSLARPRIDGSIILKWIFKNWNGAWAGFIWLR
jgi:hypothetical protein